MGKKKKTSVFVLKPWCWYCEREFEDDKVLLQHQKSKHFKCQMCPRKLNTAGGLMVHSQQVHKCEPEPLTNTLPGRDGYDVEIFGMEGVPTNALAEWKARKEAEFGTAAMAVAASGKRPRHAYTVIPEADLQAALAQHKALMLRRDHPPPLNLPPPPINQNPYDQLAFTQPMVAGMPPAFPGMPPPTLPNFQPPFPPNVLPSFQPPAVTNNGYAPSVVSPVPADLPKASLSPSAQPSAVSVLLPQNGVFWPDIDASPSEKRAQQRRYRYTSPTLQTEYSDDTSGSKKRKAAADFL